MERVAAEAEPAIGAPMLRDDHGAGSAGCEVGVPVVVKLPVADVRDWRAIVLLTTRQ